MQYLPWDAPADAHFLYDKSAVLGAVIKKKDPVLQLIYGLRL
jgi:hypothetical protein